MRKINTIIIFMMMVIMAFTACNHQKDDATPSNAGTVNTNSISSQSVFVVNGGSSSVSVIDMNSNKVSKTISLPNAIFPHHVYLSPDKTKLTVGVPGKDFSSGHDMSGMMMAMPGQVIIIDVASGNILHTITTTNMNHNAVFSPDGSEIWTGQMSMEGSVLIYDANTYQLKDSIPVGMHAAEVTFSSDGTKAFVANEGSGSITVIDVSTKQITKTITVGDGPVGAWVGSDGNMYVDSEGTQTISVISTSSLTVTETINLGFTPGMAAFNGTLAELWVSDPNNGTIHFFQKEGGAWKDKGRIATGSGAHAIAFAPDGKKAYVSNQLNGNVSVIDATNKTKITDVTVGSKPNGMAIKM